MNTRSHHHTARRGFTLIEVTTSLAIVAVLMLGLSSAIVIAAHAIPDPTASGEYDRKIIDTLNQLRDDIRDANTIQVTTTAAGARLTLALNDTGGLGAPAQAIYEYRTASDELYRQADDLDNTLMLAGITDIKLETITVNAKPVALHLIFQVPDSIEQLYEVHALLPEEPVFK